MKKIVLINLLPGDRMVLRHFRQLENMIHRKALHSATFQPTHPENLRRVLSFSSDLFYLLGHATPSEGIQIGNSFIGWSKWSQLYHQILPQSLVLNICYSQPGVYWHAHSSSSLQVVGHDNLVERTWAMKWGEKLMRKMIDPM